MLDEVGWVDDVIVNKTTGHIIDGHLRVQLALRRDEPVVPVKYVELTQDEENLILATFDPISIMAGHDGEKYSELIDGISKNENVEKILEAIQNNDNDINFTKEKEVDENIDTENECPKCGYTW